VLRVFKTEQDQLVSIDVIGEKGSWINLVNPSEEELQLVHEKTGVPIELLRYPLDEEEISRIETEPDYVLIIIKIPVVRGDFYDTLPLGIIIQKDLFITVCLENNALLEGFTSTAPRTVRPTIVYTFKKTRFLLQVLFQTAALYLKYLREIDRKSDEVERKLHQATQNKQLIRLLELQKSLVYFTTSLRSNEIVMEKLLKSQLNLESLDPDDPRLIKMYEEDEDLLEDVITENRQAIEMGEIYTRVLSGTMDAFASVISNNLNVIMKFLTSVTIVLSIPTIVASYYGMNVALPFQNSPFAFAGTLVVTALISGVIVYILTKKDMF